MLALLPTSLVLLLSSALAAAQSSVVPSATSARSLSSAPASGASSAASSSFPLSSVTVTDANGSSTVIPITVSPSSMSSNGTATSSAAFPTLTGFPTCVTDCLNHAVAGSNCSSVTDVNCFCPDRKFPSSFESCVLSSCNTTDLSPAETLAQQFCQLASNSTSLSFSQPTSTAPPSSSSGSSSSSSSSSSGTPSGSNSPGSAWALRAGEWNRERAALGVSMLGAVIGALLL